MPFENMTYPVLTVLTFWPLAAAFLLFLVKGDKSVRIVTLLASLVELVLAWPLLAFKAEAGFQFVEKIAWVEAWGLNYHMAVDGISILMIWLSILILPLCVLCSWTYISRRIK